MELADIWDSITVSADSTEYDNSELEAFLESITTASDRGSSGQGLPTPDGRPTDAPQTAAARRTPEPGSLTTSSREGAGRSSRPGDGPPVGGEHGPSHDAAVEALEAAQQEAERCRARKSWQEAQERRDTACLALQAARAELRAAVEAERAAKNEWKRVDAAWREAAQRAARRTKAAARIARDRRPPRRGARRGPTAGESPRPPPT